MHLSIITGASRGLGLAVAEQLLAAGHRVVAIARGAPPIEHPALEAWCEDLADARPAAARLEARLAAPDAAAAETVTLVNNAGVLSTLAPLEANGADELTNAIRVGLEAPMLLASAFLRATAAWPAQRRIVFVSSGLGRRAMAGSASYCAAKAGMDHLARAIALEQAARPNGARVVSLAPGIIDTDMQTQIRAADPAGFPEHERFVGFKTGGLLDTPAQAAAKLIRFLGRPDFGAEPVADVRDA